MGEGAGKSVIVGTRDSALAVAQTRSIVNLLRHRFPHLAVTIRSAQTVGDLVRDRPISTIGDKGVFVRSLERTLLAGEIDVAVHSLKDMPADMETPGLTFAAFSPRADPRDVFISAAGIPPAEMPAGSTIGTGSARRRVQLHAIRPDLVVAGIRGNVDTRLRKLAAGEYDAVILAAAGLQRLGLLDRVTEYLSVDCFVPDAGQGILAVQTRSGDPEEELVAAIDDRTSRMAALAERAVVRGLNADCHSPVGAFAELVEDRIIIRAMAATEGGERIVRQQMQGEVARAEDLGAALGRELKAALAAAV